MSPLPHRILVCCCLPLILLLAQDPVADARRKVTEAELRLKRAELERDRAKLALKAAPSDEERKTAEANLSRLEKELAQRTLEVETARLDFRSAELESHETAVKQEAAGAIEKQKASLGLAGHLPAAQAGDKEAQYQVGLVFAEPRGVQRDLIQAAEWFAKAAAQGHVPAMRSLGQFYKNYPLLWPGKQAEGLQLLLAASGKGDAEATTEVALAAEDPANELRLHRLAVSQGSILSQYLLGMMLLEGRRTPKNHAEGLRLIELARKSGDPRVLLGLAFAYQHGFAGGKDPAEAIKLMREAADKGDPDATYYLGYAHLKGEGVPKNVAEGLKHIQLAASKWQRDAQETLGSLYLEGEEVERNVDEGARLLGLAASQGDKYALAGLGELLLDGTLGAPDPERALTYLRRAAQEGVEDAQVRLAIEHLVGWHVPRDVAAARKALPSSSLPYISMAFRVAYTRPLYAGGSGMDAGEAVKMQQLFERAIAGDEKAARQFGEFMDRPRNKWKKPGSFSFSAEAASVINSVTKALATAPPLPR